jgi:hypothetical protein
MTRTRRLFVLLTMLVIAGIPVDSALAEKSGTFEITPMVGVTVGGSIDLIGGKIEFDAGPSYGGMLGYRVRDDALVILSYHRESTTAHFNVFNPSSPLYPSRSVDMDIGHLQIGGELDFSRRSRFSPLFGLTIGASHYSPDLANAERQWFFTAIAYGGATFRITKHVGLRAQARVIGTVISANTRWICGSPIGCSFSMNGVDGVVQGDFSAGVYVAF